MLSPRLSLTGIKLFHIALPVAAWREHFGLAAVLIAVVFVEVAILAANGMRCPLTAVAARYTEDRRDNFDIYLPRGSRATTRSSSGGCSSRGWPSHWFGGRVG